MAIKKLKKDIEEIKLKLNDPILTKSQQLNELSYQYHRILTDNYPKYREANKDIGDYLAITPGLSESLDEEGNIKLDGKFKSDSPEIIHYNKLHENYEKMQIEAFNHLSEEKKKTALDILDKIAKISN